MIEHGLPEFLVSAWWCLAAPAGLPVPLATALDQAVRTAVARPFATRLSADFGLLPLPLGPEVMRARIRRDLALNEGLMEGGHHAGIAALDGTGACLWRIFTPNRIHFTLKCSSPSPTPAGGHRGTGGCDAGATIGRRRAALAIGAAEGQWRASVLPRPARAHSRGGHRRAALPAGIRRAAPRAGRTSSSIRTSLGPPSPTASRRGPRARPPPRRDRRARGAGGRAPDARALPLRATLALYRSGRQADALEVLPGGTARARRGAGDRPRTRAAAARAGHPDAGGRSRLPDQPRARPSSGEPDDSLPSWPSSRRRRPTPACSS